MGDGSTFTAYFCRYAGVTVLSAVGKNPPQHLVRSTGAAMSTTGSHGVHATQRPPLAACLHPRPGGATHTRADAIARMYLCRMRSGARRLRRPTERPARTPNAVQDHAELSCQRDARLANPGPLRNSLRPVLQTRSLLDPRQDHNSRLVHQRASKRNVSTTLIQPGSEFRLGVLGSAIGAGDSRCRDEEGHLWICGQRKRVDHNPTGAAAAKTKI